MRGGKWDMGKRAQRNICQCNEMESLRWHSYWNKQPRRRNNKQARAGGGARAGRGSWRENGGGCWIEKNVEEETGIEDVRACCKSEMKWWRRTEDGAGDGSRSWARRWSCRDAFVLTCFFFFFLLFLFILFFILYLCMCQILVFFAELWLRGEEGDGAALELR